MLLMLFIALASYLLGSVPFGLILTRAAGLGDIRSIGSGNIGATNVLRTGRRDLALATLVLDSGKAAIAAFSAGWLSGGDPRFVALAGAMAFLGHCFPIFLRFKGGKGVATYFGTLIAFGWLGLVAAAAAWLLTVAISRQSSLGALVAAAFTPIVFFATGKVTLGLGITLMSFVVFLRHRANIERLIRGTEPKIGSKSDQADAAP
ncbi:MAG: glycerol-3-phosphate 1-O-acyltransferase PlsY [Pseudomonadota bacterium]